MKRKNLFVLLMIAVIMMPVSVIAKDVKKGSIIYGKSFDYYGEIVKGVPSGKGVLSCLTYKTDGSNSNQLYRLTGRFSPKKKREGTVTDATIDFKNGWVYKGTLSYKIEYNEEDITFVLTDGLFRDFIVKPEKPITLKFVKDRCSFNTHMPIYSSSYYYPRLEETTFDGCWSIKEEALDMNIVAPGLVCNNKFTLSPGDVIKSEEEGGPLPKWILDYEDRVLHATSPSGVTAEISDEVFGIYYPDGRKLQINPEFTKFELVESKFPDGGNILMDKSGKCEIVYPDNSKYSGTLVLPSSLNEQFTALMLQPSKESMLPYKDGILTKADGTSQEYKGGVTLEEYNRMLAEVQAEEEARQAEAKAIQDAKDEQTSKNRETRLKAEQKIKDRYSALRKKYNAKYGEKNVSNVVGDGEVFCKTPWGFYFNVPSGIPYAFVTELEKDLDATNKLIDKTNDELRSGLTELGNPSSFINDRCIEFSRNYPMLIIAVKEYIPSLAVQNRFGRNVKVYEVSCASSNMSSRQYIVYVVNGKVVAVGN